MGDNIKGLHDCPRVPLNYDHFSDARGDLGGCIQSLLLMTFADLESIGVFNTDF